MSVTGAVYKFSYPLMLVIDFILTNVLYWITDPYLQRDGKKMKTPACQVDATI